MHGRILIGVAAATALCASAQPSGSQGYLEMDGVDDVVIASDDFFTPELTVEAWVRPRSLHPSFMAGIVSYGTRDLSSFDFGIGPEGDRRLRFFINYNQGQRTIFGSEALELDAWRHLAVTYDGTTARLFIDGDLDAELDFNTPIKPSGPGALLAMGDDFPGASEFLGGSFDEVRIWSVARSADEIRTTMDTTLSGDEPGLLAYYDFEESAGQVVVDLAPGARHASLGATLSRGDDDPDRRTFNPSRLRSLRLSSSMTVGVAPVPGPPPEHMDAINAGPPADGWGVVDRRHADLHERSAFECDDDPDLPHVDSETFLAGADEVTLDNCNSAFYRVRFRLPPVVGAGTVHGAANADDLGVVFLNGVPLSPLLVEDDATNLGRDRTKGGRRLLGWPTADPIVERDAPIAPGLNELAFGVLAEAGALAPAGLEFEVFVEYECLADWDGNGNADTQDFSAYLNAWTAREPETDLNADGAIDILGVLVWFNVWTFGCPE